MSYQDITGITLAVMAAVAWALVCLVGHGYANTVDSISLALHRHATDSRKRHARRTAAVGEQWVRQLEADGQPASMSKICPS